MKETRKNSINIGIQFQKKHNWAYARIQEPEHDVSVS